MKITFEKEVKLVNNVLFLENIEGYVFRIFHGLLLFGRLLLFVFDKIPRAMLIWGATTIRQVRVVGLQLPKNKNAPTNLKFLP